MQRTDSHRALIKWKAANVSRHLELSTESACRMIGWQQESFRGTLAWFWRVTVLTFLQSENLLRRTGEASGCSSDSSKANRKSGGGGAPPQTSCNSKTIKFKRTKTFVLQALSKHDELLLTVSVVFWLQTDLWLCTMDQPNTSTNHKRGQWTSSLYEDILTLKLLPAWNKNTQTLSWNLQVNTQSACNTPTTRLQHKWNTRATCRQHTCNTPPTHVEHTNNTCATRLKQPRNTPATHRNHTCNTPLTWLQHKWNTPATRLSYDWNTPETRLQQRLKHACNTPATHQKHITFYQWSTL